MSRLRRDRSQRKLNRMLEAADDEAFFIMAWAVRALQSDNHDAVGNILSYPAEAVTTELTSRYAVYPWKIETLLNESLAIRKLPIIRGQPNRILNCQIWPVVAELHNTLRDLEDACDGIYLKNGDVFLEMGRLTQRQFEWQRGFLSYAQFFRAGYLYGGPLTAAFFANRNGFTVPELVQAGFLLYALCRRRQYVTRDLATEEIGLPSERFRAILDLISISLADARRRAAELRAGVGHVGYKMSLFREFPCVAFGARNERIRAPLPDLLALRCTSGMFYDVVKGGHPINNEVGARFEQYSYELIQAWLPEYEVSAALRYRFRGSDIETPDIRVRGESGVKIIFECKAARMSYVARFGENPFQDASRGFEEIAKGVFQIWRYAAHVRLGLVPDEHLDTNASGVVLTLDSWLSMTRPLRLQVLEKAQDMARQNPDILPADQIPILFCPIDDLERAFTAAHDDVFFNAVAAAHTEEFDGWMLSGVAPKVAPEGHARNWYPFEERMAEVLPWWDRFARNE